MKILENGIAVLENDTHLRRWIENSGRMDGGCDIRGKAKPYVKNGDWVVDVGASLGDHTCTYADMVGPEGLVIAFEPQPESMECLNHNVKQYPWVMTLQMAAGVGFDQKWLDRHENIGASRLHHTQYCGGPATLVPVISIDMLGLQRLDYLKIDAEGFECYVLSGAQNTIKRCRPVIMCEVAYHLFNYGFSPDNLIALFTEFSYKTACFFSNLELMLQ